MGNQRILPLPNYYLLEDVKLSLYLNQFMSRVAVNGRVWTVLPSRCIDSPIYFRKVTSFVCQSRFSKMVYDYAISCKPVASLDANPPMPTFCSITSDLPCPQQLQIKIP
jgi:hypothetical protein